MKTFIVGPRDRVHVLGSADVVFITSQQHAAAVTISQLGPHLGLSEDEFNDLMDHLGGAPDPKVRGKKAWPTEQKDAPVLSNEHRPDLDGMSWQQIIDLGPEYKIKAIKRLRETDSAFYGLKEAKDHVEAYMDARNF